MKKYNITIDEKLLNEYYDYYFEEYPRRRVKPIKGIFPPSLNAFTAMKRIQQNNVKQKYKEFSKWMASYYGIANLQMEKIRIDYKFYFGDRRRRDMDNMMITPKFINDGLVDAGVMIDDDGKHLHIGFEPFKYDKEHPRIEMEIREI